MNDEGVYEYNLSLREAVNQPPLVRAERLAAARAMRIEELRESMDRQTDLIESLESQCSNDKQERDKLKRRIDDHQDAYDGLLAEYIELQHLHAKQGEKLKHAEAARDFWIDANTRQAGTIARLYKEMDATLDLDNANKAELEALRARYKALLGENTELRNALDYIRRATDI